MKNAHNDKEFKEFLNKHRPQPLAPSEHERTHLFNTILSHSIKKKSFIPRLTQGLAVLSLVAVLVFSYSQEDASPVDETVVINAIDESYGIQDEADEDTVVSDLLALAE